MKNAPGKTRREGENRRDRMKLGGLLGVSTAMMGNRFEAKGHMASSRRLYSKAFLRTDRYPRRSHRQTEEADSVIPAMHRGAASSAMIARTAGRFVSWSFSMRVATGEMSVGRHHKLHLRMSTLMANFKRNPTC